MVVWHVLWICWHSDGDIWSFHVRRAFQLLFSNEMERGRRIACDPFGCEKNRVLHRYRECNHGIRPQYQAHLFEYIYAASVHPRMNSSVDISKVHFPIVFVESWAAHLCRSKGNPLIMPKLKYWHDFVILVFQYYTTISHYYCLRKQRKRLNLSEEMKPTSFVILPEQYYSDFHLELPWGGIKLAQVRVTFTSNIYGKKSSKSHFQLKQPLAKGAVSI